MPQPTTDIEILNFALTLEHFESALYRTLISANLLTGPEAGYLTTFGGHEAAHVTALTNTIRTLGGTPVAALPAYNLPRIGSRAELLNLLVTVEDLGAAAYLGQAGFVQNKDLLEVAVNIHNIEAEHAAVWRFVSGLPAAPRTVEQGLDYDTVIARVTPFLSGAPAMAQVAPAPVAVAPAPVAVAATAPATGTGAETIFAVTPNNLLLRFSSASVQVIDRAIPITGLQAGETLLGIDFRPANKQLYALGGTSRIYTLNLDTGAATQVGTSQFSPRIIGRVYGFDFNPMADAIRLISSEDQNLRISPTTGQVVGADTNLAYIAGDTNAGKSIIGVAAAYTNNVAAATSTQLYVIDAANDVLGRIDTPNNGQVRTIGALGGGAGGYVSFDIANGVAFAVFSTATSSAGVVINSPFEPAFGTIDLTTGKFTPVSPVGVAINNLEIVGIAVQPR